MCSDLIQSIKHFTTLALAALALPAFAAPVVTTEHVEARLIAERAGLQPGKPATIGVQLRLTPQWHTYWKNPGDSGLPTRIKWTLPQGWKAGEIQWPYPKPLPIGPLMNFGYEDEVVLLTEITPSAKAAAGPVDIKAHVDWLVCKDICIPEQGDLDLQLPVANKEAAIDPRGKANIDNARSLLPVDAPGWKFESALSGKSLVVRLAAPAGATPPSKAQFFPEREGLIEPAAPQKLTREGNAIRIEMKLAEPVPADVTRVSGVAVSDAGWAGAPDKKAIEVSAKVGTLPPVSPAATVGTQAIGGSTLVALAFAFIGGLLLNLMPCVFPVLGIKVMGFVEHAHGDPRALRMQGAVFGIGVLMSFLLLAGLMLGLRATGTQLGWGFQLQSPAFVTLLAILFFVLALNLSGVFEWGAFAQSMTSDLSAKGRYADAFIAGVLASVVATPCTAPFMGAAVGFTLSQDAAVALAIFAMLGIGMALPVVALSAFPRLLKRLPKPGPWMEVFKQVLAFPLYATVAWLAWVIGAQVGNDAVLMLLGGLVLIAMGAWIYGRWGHSERFLEPGIALVLALAGIMVAWPGAVTETTSESSSTKPVAKLGELPWQAWSPERVNDLREQGYPVFVDFTAAWCVTCQVNKRVALHNTNVMRAFTSHQVVPLRADWTRQDPRITATLSALGRNAVPVYALYIPGEAQPRLLPEVLSPAIVLEALGQLPEAKNGRAIVER